MKNATLLWIFGGVVVVGAATTAAVLLTKKSAADAAAANPPAPPPPPPPAKKPALDAAIVDLVNTIAPYMPRPPVTIDYGQTN